jgi:electron transfer flavoprotein beta subunit
MPVAVARARVHVRQLGDIAVPTGNNGRAMNVIVCVKQIPDPATPGALGSDNTLKRDGKLILDESDSYGVEMALQLVDAAGGGEVSLVSMAPNGEVSGMRTALAMGAAKGTLVSDPALQGSDALTTAKVLGARHPEDGRRRPGHRRHREQRRLHGHRARAVGRSARSALGHLRQEGHHLGRHARTRIARPKTGTTRSPARCPLSSASPPAWSSLATPASRASWLPRASRSTRSPPPTSGSSRWVGPAPVRAIVSVTQAEARAAGEIIEDDGEGFAKIVAFLENLKVI